MLSRSNTAISFDPRGDLFLCLCTRSFLLLGCLSFGGHPGFSRQSRLPRSEYARLPSLYRLRFELRTLSCLLRGFCVLYPPLFGELGRLFFHGKTHTRHANRAFFRFDPIASLLDFAGFSLSARTGTLCARYVSGDAVLQRSQCGRLSKIITCRGSRQGLLGANALDVLRVLGCARHQICQRAALRFSLPQVVDEFAQRRGNLRI